MRLVDFLERIEAQRNAFARARALYSDRLAPDFSPFEFIEANEVRLSAIIAWMLRPSGSHGQGYLFLSKFVQAFDIRWKEEACGSAVVRTEVATSRLDASRRIDILVQTGDRAFAIENKPWAEDQERQVSDYLIHLDSEFLGGYSLIYLSGDGSPPGDGSIRQNEAAQRIADGQLSVVGYGDLLPWLKDCKSECRADRVSTFLDEFIRYIQQHFLKEPDVTEREQIVSDIVGSPAMVSSAMQVIFAADQIKHSLIKQLGTQLQVEADARGWGLVSKIDGPVLWSGFSIRYYEKDETTFTMEFGDRARAIFYYGIRGVDAGHPKYEQIHRAITGAFGAARKTEIWPWCRSPSLTDQVLPVDADWSTSERPWIAIADASLAARIISAAQQFHDILKKEGLLTAGTGLETDFLSQGASS